MALQLYAHPFSSYCQKVLIALYENAIPFELRMLAVGDEHAAAEHAALWPFKKMPILVDDGRVVPEATIIIEYLGLHYPGAVRLIPEDPRAALEVRTMDRIFDNYVMSPMQRIVLDTLRRDEREASVAEARVALDVAYQWLDRIMADREWAAGGGFSLADCAAAPSLFYADWTHRIGEKFPHLRAYRSRLLARPSFARAVDGARPYRANFPLGVPDQD